MTSVLLLALALQAHAGSDFLTLVRKAETRKEPEEKVEWYGRAIAAYEPSYPKTVLADCHLRRGEAHYELWEFPAAEPDLTKALALDGGAARAYLLRGRIRLRKADAAGAAADLSEYTVQRADDVEGWLSLGEAELKRQKPDAALAAFGRVDAIDPTDYRGPLSAARAFAAKKDWKKSLERLSAAEPLAKGRSADVYSERAVALVATARHEDALRAYTAALPLFERRLEAERRGRAPQPALDEDQDALARAYYGRGRVNEFLVRMPDAAEDYKTACELGHKQACGRATSAAKAAEKAAPELAPPAAETEAERPRPKKRRKVKLDEDPGDRIYAN